MSANISYITDATPHIKLGPNIQYDPEYLSDKILIPADEIREHDWWHEIAGKWYFFRCKAGDHWFLNELLCSFALSKYFDINSVKHKMATGEIFEKELYGLLSKNFRDSKHQYFTAASLNLVDKRNDETGSLENFDKLQNLCQSRSDYYKLIKDIFKMLAFDFYANQVDRSSGENPNYYFQFENGEIRIAPLFDYEKSFCLPWKDSTTVSNHIYRADLYSESLQTLFNRFPFGYEIFKSISGIDIDQMLSAIEKAYVIQISKSIKAEYKEFDEGRKNLIMKL